MIRQRTSQILFNYWNEARGSAVAPRRLDIEPSRISTILPDTFILECGSGPEVRFRLAGTRICDQLGRELRGIDFLSLWSVADRQPIATLLEAVTTRGAGGLIEFSIDQRQADGAAVEALLLPLVHDGEVTRILGSMSFKASDDLIGHAGLRSPRLLHAMPLWPDGRPHKVIETLDRQSPFLARPRESRIVRFDRLQLRVYEGGRSGQKVER